MILESGIFFSFDSFSKIRGNLTLMIREWISPNLFVSCNIIICVVPYYSTQGNEAKINLYFPCGYLPDIVCYDKYRDIINYFNPAYSLFSHKSYDNIFFEFFSNVTDFIPCREKIVKEKEHKVK